jgi:hypothetical protein
MRGQRLTGLLLYEAKIKPEIKALVDKVTTLTDQDIERAVVPLPWYRDALRQLREEERTKTLVVTSIDGFMPNPMGTVAYWNQVSTFIKVTNRSSLEIKEGFPVWFPDGGGVWLDTVFCATIPQEFRSLTRSERMSKTQYSVLLRERRNKML